MRNLTFDIGQKSGGDFAKFCGLLRIYELYLAINDKDKAHLLLSMPNQTIRIALNHIVTHYISYLINDHHLNIPTVT